MHVLLCDLIPVIVVFCGLAHFKLYLRAHLKCFVYLYEQEYPGAGSKKDMYKHIIQNLILTRTQLKFPKNSAFE